MRTCPACKKVSASYRECTHCGVFFSKWEKRQSVPTVPSEPQSQLTETVSSSERVIQVSGLTKVVLIVAAVLVAVWFFTGSNSDESKVKADFQGFWRAMKAANPDQMKKYLARPYANELLASGGIQTLERMKKVMPDQYEITRVAVQKDAALVDIRGVKEGMSISATTKYIKENGEWKVAEHTWHLGDNEGSPANGPTGSETPETPSTAETKLRPLAQISDDDQSARARDYREQFGNKSTQELLMALKTEPLRAGEPIPPRELILSYLVNRGAKEEAIQTLNEMLRNQNSLSVPQQAKTFLQALGAPITFASQKSHPFGDIKYQEIKFDWLEWSVEVKGDSIFSSGKLYLDRDVIDGFSRPQKDDFKVPVFARYKFQVTGPGLAIPVEKTVDAQAQPGEQSWDQVLTASGLAPGKYEVRLSLQAQTVMHDGVPLALSSQGQTLTVER